MFYAEGICLDLSHAGLRELIETSDLISALKAADLQIKKGDTVLLYTDHYRRSYGTDDWHNGPGISTDAARWLGEQEIAAFGVETMSPGVVHVSNKEVHRICGELGFTHYENMINLHQLIGRGVSFIGLPLRIRGEPAHLLGQLLCSKGDLNRRQTKIACTNLASLQTIDKRRHYEGNDSVNGVPTRTKS
jgi:kynurenine formamidase